jgi:hypothetical protein
VKPFKKLIFFVFLLGIWIGGEVSSQERQVESLLPKEDLPEGWTLAEGPKVYTKKTLFERIDGQAELFFKYGFRRSAFAMYQERKDQKRQIEVDIYDMGTVPQAFGIFSRFRNEEKPGGFGLESYLDDQSAFFYKGKYFTLFYAAEPEPSALKRMAVMVATKIRDSSLPPREIDFFPRKGLKPGSIQYFPEGLLGYQFLRRGFQGTYLENLEAKVGDEDKSGTRGKEFRLFIGIYKDGQEARNTLTVYKDHLSKKGKIYSFGPNGLKGEDPYKGRVMVAQKGVYFLGVVGFDKEEEGERYLAEFVKRVK